MNKNIEIFKQLKYGMMIHWGLYSLLAGEYDGVRCKDNYAEWIQANLAIPIKEYEKLAQAFNPIYFDAEKIVLLAKECGMRYIVITAKHHEGFALFKSDVDSFNVCDSTPLKRDIIKELSDACKKHGLKFGIYYSQDLDWHEHNGGGYLSNHISCSGVTWDNSWDFNGEKDFSICFEKKILPQVKELMSNYGEIFLVWFDVPMTLTKEQSKTLYDTVKSLQPNCLINSRIGNGMYDYVSFGDNEIPNTLNTDSNNVDYNSIDGIKPSPNGLYEVAATLNHTWGFSYFDHDFKAPEEIFETRQKLENLGVNYLLNVGLDGLGRIPSESISVLRTAAELYKK